MKILYIIGQLDRGGAEQQFYYLLKHLRPDACVISLRQGGYWAEPIRALGMEVIELKRHGRGDVARLIEIIRIIHRYKPDIIHIFIDNLYGLYGRLAALLTGHPRVIVGERAHPTYDPKWYIHLRQFWLNHSVRYVVANSQAAIDYLTQQMSLPQHKAVFIPNGIEIERIVAESQKPPVLLPTDWKDVLVIGTVADVSARKNPELFLEVARRVVSEHPNVRFVWVGDGELRTRVETRRNEFNLQNVVLFAGHQLDVPRWLTAMDVFILTSNYEGTSNSLMEAMVVGLPCVVTDTGGSASLVCNGETGFIVPLDNPEKFSERICCLIEDAQLRQRLGTAGRGQIEAFDVGKMAEAYHKLYLSLFSGSGGSPSGT